MKIWKGVCQFQEQKLNLMLKHYSKAVPDISVMTGIVNENY
jgi:hypothetical protein